MMDTGSQRSYITESVKGRLALTATGQQHMTILTFCASKKGDHVCEYVKVGLKLKNGQSQIVTLFCVPKIC